MPKIGMAGSTMMLAPWNTALRAAIDLGFEAFEIFGEYPQCVIDEITSVRLDEAKAMVRASGIELAVHSPFNSLNLAALNPGVRRESVRQIKQAIELCAELGGKATVVHNGEYTVGKRIREEVPIAAKLIWDFNVAGLKELAAHAREQGVLLCLENIGFEPEHMDRNVDDLLRIKAEVDEPALAFCLDIGHARLNHELPEAIAKMGPWVAHVHFTDNFGKRDDHVIIGEGNFDYSPHLEFFRSFPHVITLEVVKVGLDPTPAAKSRENFKRLVLEGKNGQS